jgi:sarcosine oxidase subunit gamma
MSAKMTEAPTQRHGLEHFLGGPLRGNATGSIVDIQVQPGLGHLNLRGNAGNPNFVKATEDILGQKLPTVPNTMSANMHRVYWLGPDEWLILTDSKTLVEELQQSLSPLHGAVNDVSGGQIALRVSGTQVRDVLAKGCTLDFHPRVFTAGMCAQSGLAKASVLFSLTGEADTFDVIVRRSFADYLVRWLRHAADEYGVRIESA